jgi:hypothetical protein
MYFNFMEKQFSFYDSEVSKLTMSAKTYTGPESPTLPYTQLHLNKINLYQNYFNKQES